MSLPSLLLAGFPLLSLPVPEIPRTTPERSGYTRTSTSAEVEAFLDALGSLPHADRLRPLPEIGRTAEGRSIRAVLVGNPPPEGLAQGRGDDKLRVLINANIHGGEVEGKEAVQMLLREFALGEHAELLEGCDLLFIPLFNADGNDRIARKNRVTQNGPSEGVGERAGAHGLDLNRDFIKLESPECRALVAATAEFDPHLWMDLHTTNGSPHAYHLTYAPSLATGIDPAIDSFARENLLPEVRRAMLAHHGMRVFDYGNLVGDPPTEWVTYDPRPRFGTNYIGLRGRFSILSEAYSYLPFEERILVTRAFVLECLRAAAVHAEQMQRLCAEADAAVRDGQAELRWGTHLAPGVEGQVLLAPWSEIPVPGLGVRRVAGQEWHPARVKVRVAFESESSAPLPDAYALVDPPEECLENLRLHGVACERLAEPRVLLVRTFRPSEVLRAKRPFQGHHELEVVGRWEEGRERSLPAGTLIVRTRQPLGRLAATLLDPRSEDSLSTWNFLEERTRSAGEGEVGEYPVLWVVKGL